MTRVGLEKLLCAFALSLVINRLLRRRRVLLIGFTGVDSALLAK
jgi:hypothetical protein